MRDHDREEAHALDEGRGEDHGAADVPEASGWRAMLSTALDAIFPMPMPTPMHASPAPMPAPMAVYV